MYAVVDLETTGGNAKFGKITEIAIYLHDGFQVVDEFVSLINPECSIPDFITRLTGITNEMVADAPKFYEVAKRVVEITEGHVFVAHNAGFDYNFLKWEFKRLGYHFERDTLCTVKLSKEIVPGFKSYSLGKLVGEFGIKIKDRHRAGGDAFATVKLLEILMQKGSQKAFERQTKRQVLPGRINEHLNKSAIDALPDEVGVYYFFDKDHELLYIGKSKQIRTRVVKHLHKPTSARAMDLKNKVAEIQYELTGSELLALLKESEEIKKHQPFYNKAQIRNSFKYGIFAEFQIDGFIHFRYGKIKGADPIILCSTEEEARNQLYRLSKRHKLCLQLSDLEKASDKPCFHYNIKFCNGACAGKESPKAYNQRAETAIKTSNFKYPNFLVLDNGRHEEELAVVKVENGRYQGYGYADISMANNNLDYLKDCTKGNMGNREISRIIQGYIKRKNQSIKLIQY